MKKTVIAICLVLTLALSLCLTGCGGSDKLTLNVYNWGEYISDGRNGSFNTIEEFKNWYRETYGTEIEVNYNTYDSNENMYSKISNGAVSFDVIIPSDYMIARMADEGLLLPLNYDNIPNYKYIDDSFKGLYYDKNNEYSIPYTYGIVGIIYDANVVDPADATGWDLMWNPKYSGSILQYNNSRDAFGTAMYKLGLDVNTADTSVWDQPRDELLVQRPFVKSYVMDEIYNMMQSGEASVASYYAGDYFTMRDAQAENIDLQFIYPEPTNYFIDAMCIPSCCRNKELAEIFINYMLSPEPAIANAELINYASPNSAVYTDPGYIEDMGEDAMEILYPDLGNFADSYNEYAYRNLSRETLDYINSIWEKFKLN